MMTWGQMRTEMQHFGLRSSPGIVVGFGWEEKYAGRFGAEERLGSRSD